MSKKFYFLTGSSIFIIFILFSFLVHKNLFTVFDFDTTVRLQSHVSRRFDEFFSFLSLIGRFEIMAIALVVILAIRFRLHGIFIFFLFGIIHLVELYGKTFVDHLPPPHFLLRTHLPLNFPEFYVRTENSYPSGHAARALFITSILFLFNYKSKKLSPNAKKIILLILVGYDIVMCVSRVYLGEHWTTDVIGGALLGMGLAIIAAALF